MYFAVVKDCQFLLYQPIMVPHSEQTKVVLKGFGPGAWTGTSVTCRYLLRRSFKLSDGTFFLLIFDSCSNRDRVSISQKLNLAFFMH